MRKRILGQCIAVLATMVMIAACGPPPELGPPPASGGYNLESDPSADTLAFASVFSGLDAPVNLAFAPGGRAFVAELAGTIKTFDSVHDTTPTITADLSDEVHSSVEHGLMGLTVDNAFPTRPFIYALYAWDPTGLLHDRCASGYEYNGCRADGRLVRIEVDAEGVMVGSPQMLVQDRWCFQFSGHSVGDLEMLPDGSLVVSAGEGANWAGTDYGQFGGKQLFPPVGNLTPPNPCGDPPGGAGVATFPADGEGGSFRSQDILTEGDPVGWNGALARIDADTGAPMPDNHLVGTGTTDDDAVIAHGFRNPSRITVRPGTDRVYVANVGQDFAEEIDWVDVTAPVRNFGWPCREGAEANPPFDALGNHICEELITEPGAKSVLTDPWFYYNHNGKGAAVTGLSFVPEGRYPDKYVGDLFFADYVLGNVWAISVNPDGTLAPTPPEAVAHQPGVVDLDSGVDGYLYAVNVFSGTVDRLVGADSPPVPRLEAMPENGPTPLVTDLDASGSFQPGGGLVTFEWDLDDDGEFDDGTGPVARVAFDDGVNHDVHVRVTNESDATAVASRTIHPDNAAPVVTVDVTSALPWTAGDQIEFDVSAADAEDGALGGASVSWATTIRHCYEPTDCHSHPLVTGTGTTGSFEAPSHGFPSYVELTVRATDSRGQTTELSQDLGPATAEITLGANVAGAAATVGQSLVTMPTTHTAILGSSVSLAASLTQVIDGVTYAFDSWSDGGAATHQVLVTEDLDLELVLVPQ